MGEIIDLKDAALELKIKKAYRNWNSRFNTQYHLGTKAQDIGNEALKFLIQGKGEGLFYIYDLIMHIEGLGSGAHFYELPPEQKMRVIDRFLLILDILRFEYMKRLGWIKDYPGQEYTLVDLILSYEQLAPSLRAQIPSLSRNHPLYQKFCLLNYKEKEILIRKLIPKALNTDIDYSTTL